MRSYLAVILLMLVLVLQVFSEPRGVHAASGTWTQSSQADFESGIMNNVVYNPTEQGLAPASGGHLETMGYPAVDSNQTRTSAGETAISAFTGVGAPVSGHIVGYAVFLKSVSASPSFKLKVFRDNGTHTLFVAESVAVTYLSVGRNYVDLSSSPLLVNRGDELGFYFANYGIAATSSNYCPTLIKSGDIITTMTTSSWQFPCTNTLSVEAVIEPFVTGSFLSSVKDTGGSSTWGTMIFHAAFWGYGCSLDCLVDGSTGAGLLALQTRTSNDLANWSPWSPRVYIQGYTTTSPVSSPPGRFIQYTASIGGNGTLAIVLRDVTISFTTTPLSSTILEPSAILSLTVLIAAVAALAITFKRSRKPPTFNTH